MHSARDEVIVLATAAAKGWQGGGPARVRVSDDIRGLRHGWIAAYCPSHASDYAIILEDDTEVGEDFLQYTVEAMPSAAARASIGGSGAGLASLSLSPRTLDGVTGKRIDSGVSRGGQLQREQHMSPHVSTWGVVPIPEVWVGFVKWYSDQDMGVRCPELLPGAQGLKLTDWYSSDLADGRGSSMWSLHWTVFISDVADGRPLMVLYPNEPGAQVGMLGPGARTASTITEGRAHQLGCFLWGAPLFMPKASPGMDEHR